MEEEARSVSSKRIQVGSKGKNEDEEARTMTNEEAIKTIKYNCYVELMMDYDRGAMINTALDMARDALSKQIAKKWDVLKRNGDDIEIREKFFYINYH